MCDCEECHGARISDYIDSVARLCQMILKCEKCQMLISEQRVYCSEACEYATEILQQSITLAE